MSSFSKLHLVQEKILETLYNKIISLYISYSLHYITWTTNEQY